MSYEDALVWLQGLGRFGVQLGTGRTLEVLRRLGDPQRRFPALHIAGTNGKGSTAALCASLLLSAGRAAGADAGPVGLYTSPHLLRLTERVQLSAPGHGGLLECPSEELAAALLAVRAAAAASPPQALTYFEAVTAAAFLWFAERRAAVVVIETGLGGRLDATRLCEPLATCVTGVSKDHTEWLGDRLVDIAREKAGIFRAGVPAIIACEDRQALAVLCTEATAVGARLAVYPKEVPPLDEELALALALPGAHQQRNGALALALAQAAPAPFGSSLANRTVQRAGLAAARWPGRLERIDVPAGEVWLDAAHNAEGAAALLLWLRERQAQRPLCVLFGVVADKDAGAMLGPALGAQSLVLCRPPSARGRPPADLLPLLDAARYRGTVRVLDDVAPALAAALGSLAPGGMLLAYGSIFLVGEVRRLILGEAVDPVPTQDPMRRDERGSRTIGSA